MYNYPFSFPPPMYVPHTGLTLEDVEKSMEAMERIKKTLKDEQDKKKAEEDKKKKKDPPKVSIFECLMILTVFSPVVGPLYYTFVTYAWRHMLEALATK